MKIKNLFFKGMAAILLYMPVSMLTIAPRVYDLKERQEKTIVKVVATLFKVPLLYSIYYFKERMFEKVICRNATKKEYEKKNINS